MSLRLRVLLPFVCIGALLMLTLYGYWMPRHTADLKHVYREATEKHLVSVVEGLVPLLLAHQLDAVYENLDALMLQNANWRRLRLFNADGVALYPLFLSASSPAGADVRVMEQPIRLNEADLGRLVVEVDLDEPLEDMHARHRQLLGFTAVVLLLSVGATWLVIERLVSRPVTRLARASRLLAEGEFAAPLPPVQPDEVGELVKSFGDMRSSISAYQAELVSRNESLVKLSHAVEQSPVSIVIADSAGRIEFVNPRFNELMGCAPGEMLGKDLSLLKTDERSEPSFDEIRRAVSAGKVWHGEFQSRHAGGRVFWQSASFSGIQNEGGETTHVVALLEDVSERRALEDQLRRAQKMEAIGTLAGGIAHDFNNILAAIFGHAELIRYDLPPESKYRQSIEGLLRAGSRARDLVYQILAFSRQAEQERRPLLVQPIVKEALKLLRASLPSTVEIRESIQPCDPVLSDPTQIHQILMNLCTNAFHAIRSKGTGVIGVSLSPLRIGEGDRRAEFGLLAPGPYVKLEVSDTGCGMDAATLERIFEPYFTTKAKGEGTGLGLAVVHGIVKSHGGHVSVYSEPGVGSTFKVYLPACEPPVDGRGLVGPDDIIPATEALPGGTERVLLADDERELVEVEGAMLGSLGYRVEPHTDPVAALAAFAREPGAYDLLVTDMTMPELTGDELARRVLALRPGFPIVLCTGFSEIIDGERSRRIGVREFIMKPVLKADLAAAVRRALDRR